MAENVVGSMTPACSLSSRCVRPSDSQRMRQNVQCPNDTPCSPSRICNARTSARVASLTRCASRSSGTASRQCRRITCVLGDGPVMGSARNWDGCRSLRAPSAEWPGERQPSPCPRRRRAAAPCHARRRHEARR